MEKMITVREIESAPEEMSAGDRAIHNGRGWGRGWTMGDLWRAYETHAAGGIPSGAQWYAWSDASLLSSEGMARLLRIGRSVAAKPASGAIATSTHPITRASDCPITRSPPHTRSRRMIAWRPVPSWPCASDR